MGIYDITVKMPVLSLNVSGEYSRFKKPAGLENLILTAIGTDALNGDTWGEFFNRLAIPERMAPLFREVIANLHDNGVVDTEDFDLDDPIDRIGFTETGRDLFEQGRIKQEPKVFHENIFFAPYAKYSDPSYLFQLKTSGPEGFRPEAFSGVACDLEDLKQFVMDNKDKVGAGRDDEILSVSLDMEPEMVCTRKKVTLEFDEVSGEFSFMTEMDPNFIKGYFRASDFLDSGSDIFQPSKDVVPKTPGTIPGDWESYRYGLPREFSFKGLLRAYDPGLCESASARAVDGLGYAFADIQSSNAGRGYLFITKKVPVSGLEGNRECTLMVSRPLSPEDIDGILGKVVSTADMSDPDSFMDVLPLAAVHSDPGHAESLVAGHLAASNDIIASARALSKAGKAKWAPRLSDLLEEAVVSRGMTEDEFVNLLRLTGIKARCETACKHYSKDEKSNLALADKLFPVCINKAIVTATLGIREEMARSILENRQGAFRSQELQAMANTAAAVSRLKEIFGVVAPSKCDLEAFDGARAQEALNAYSTASKGMNVVGPLMAGAPSYPEAEEYMSLFQNLTEVYCKDMPLDRLSGWMFGVGIRRKMESLLRSCLGDGKLEALIDKACPEYVDEETKAILHKARKYGNECAHNQAAPPIDADTKKQWIKAVDRLDNAIKTKRKEGKK